MLKNVQEKTTIHRNLLRIIQKLKTPSWMWLRQTSNQHLFTSTPKVMTLQGQSSSSICCETELLFLCKICSTTQTKVDKYHFHVATKYVHKLTCICKATSLIGQKGKYISDILNIFQKAFNEEALQRGQLLYISWIQNTRFIRWNLQRWLVNGKAPVSWSLLRPSQSGVRSRISEPERKMLIIFLWLDRTNVPLLYHKILFNYFFHMITSSRVFGVYSLGNCLFADTWSFVTITVVKCSSI